jgi:uncharacterized protein with PhoU and TrkA domain
MDTFDADPSTQRVEYRPVGVKDLLIAMKDSSELIVDLAYSAVLHNSVDLAGEVLQLESRMDILQMQARMNMLMATRKPEEARLLAPVLGIIGAAEKISEAAGDIAHVVLGEEQLPGAFRAALPDAMEVLARAPVDSGSEYTGRTLGGIDLETATGVRVIALRRDDDWVLNPDYETTVSAGDVLLLRGAEPNVSGVYETVTGEAYETPGESDPGLSDLTRAVDTIVLMKNVSELSVDLAYASVLFDDAELAEEVHALEIEVDSLQSRLEAWTLQAASEVDDPVSLRGLLHLASSTEMISDAALEITEGILREIDSHPVIAESVRESDVSVRRARVDTDSGFDDEPLGTLLDAHPGVAVIAIHRPDDEWVFYPDGDAQIGAEDVLIARGTWEATERLLGDDRIS